MRLACRATSSRAEIFFHSCGRSSISTPAIAPRSKVVQADRRITRARVPLRLGLAGGGTDVSPYCDEFGGAILNSTIDYYAYAALEPLQSETVEFVSADLNESASYSAASVLPNDGRLDLFKAIYNYVVRE